MAWGLFSNATWVFVVITIVTGGLIVFILLKTLKTMPRNLQLGLALVLSGAIGNLIDRVALGYVRDFIAFDFMNFPVFNFADSCITVGAVLLIVSVLFTKSGRAYLPHWTKKAEARKNGRRKNRGLRGGQRRRSGCRTRRKTGGKQMNSDSERTNGQLPEKNSGECAEKPAKMQMTETSAVSLFRMKFFAARRKPAAETAEKLLLRHKKRRQAGCFCRGTHGAYAFGGAKAASLRCGNGQRSFRKSKVCRAHG